MDNIPVLALIASIVAVLISLLTLWRTHLRPPKIRIVASDLTMRVYSFKNTWFVPTVLLPISITNEGARTGIVNNFRIKILFPEVRKNAYDSFSWNCCVDPQKFNLDANNFNKWHKTSIVARTEPFFMAPKETKVLHPILIVGWERLIVLNETKLLLEAQIGNKWHAVQSWRVGVYDEDWDALKKGISITYPPENEKRGYPETFPDDLREIVKAIKSAG